VEYEDFEDFDGTIKQYRVERKTATVWYKGRAYTRKTENRYYPFRDGTYPDHPNAISDDFRPISK